MQKIKGYYRIVVPHNNVVLLLFILILCAGIKFFYFFAKNYDSDKIGRFYGYFRIVAPHNIVFIWNRRVKNSSKYVANAVHKICELVYICKVD